MDWMLSSDNPAVALRAQTQILGAAGDKQAALQYLSAALPADWRQAKGLKYRYYATAIAECGLTRDDIDMESGRHPSAVLMDEFDGNCADFMLLRALVMTGFLDDVRVRSAICQLPEARLPDGGYLCLHRLSKLIRIPKSCIKANLHALLFCAECARRGLVMDGVDELCEYFLRRGLFYRSDDPTKLVLNCRPGWRTIDTFHPIETQRVGLHMVVEALCALGHGRDPRMDGAWTLLRAHRDAAGRYRLDGTLTKSYLPKERVGQPNRWVSFYAQLAEHEQDNPAKK